MCAIAAACDFRDPVGSDEPETSDEFNGPEGMRLDVVRPVVERTGISVLELGRKIEFPPPGRGFEGFFHWVITSNKGSRISLLQLPFSQISRGFL